MDAQIIRVERLARTYAADNWLHSPRRERRLSPWVLAYLAALHGLVIVLAVALVGAGR